jgi:hypothetical protein
VGVQQELQACVPVAPWVKIRLMELSKELLTRVEKTQIFYLVKEFAHFS